MEAVVEVPAPLHGGGCNGPLVSIEWAKTDRWDGPADARLICCACGKGIRGSDQEVEAARLADEAYTAAEASS